ncbi:MAG TPA: AraC family transcriptional regulator [Saprospiraceae bacterium]|nr:AraC family transcriptional regulator [Saprospiraceae bacterium]
MNQTSILRKDITIHDYAVVSEFTSANSSTLDFQSDAMDIYLICTRRGKLALHASFIPHPLELASSEAIFLAYPRGPWTLTIQAEEGTDFYMIKMAVSILHKMLNPAFDDQQLNKTSGLNMRDLMRLIPVNPSLMTCFDQLLHHKISASFSAIFEKAKFLEIFSLLMETTFGNPMEACPVMLSPAIENKLHQVRRHIIEHIDESPDPDKLAVMYELPRNTLREGYRYVFGKTIHQYHSDHKLESALQMLNQGELLVKEIAFRIGYQNPSHFISAFKKKFGYTPKQYLRKEVIA